MLERNTIEPTGSPITKTTGNSNDIAAKGPIPGNTPTKVPRMVPTAHSIKLSNVSAIANPSMTLLKFSKTNYDSDHY